MPTLPIELTKRTLGPTGVTARSLDRSPERDVARLRISYLLDGLQETSTAPPISMIRMCVNALAAFIATMFVTLSAFALVPMAFGYHSAIVASSSMEPSLRRSDVVVLAPIDDDPIRVGEIVNFRSDSGTVIHRVTAIDSDGYRTKGDANQSADSTLVAADDINGTGVFLVPFVGLPPLWADAHEWWKLMAASTVLAGAAYSARRSWLSPVVDA